MLKRCGTWMYRYRGGLPAAILVAGVLALVLNGDGGFRGVEMAFWQSQAQACGTLTYLDVPPGIIVDPQATTCFMQAYTHCRAATLVESSGGGNTAARSTFVIEPVLLVGGVHPCSIQVNSFGGLGVRPSNSDWVECTGGMEQRSDGLHFYSCGRFGDFVVGSP